MKKILLIMLTSMTFLVFSQSAFDDPLGADTGADATNITTEDSGQSVTTELEQVVAVDKPEDLSIKLPKLLENIFDGKNMNAEELLGGDDPEIKGYISNLQQAPFNQNIISFEVTVPESPAVKLYLYNIESQFLVHISPIENYEKNIKMIPYPVKDRGVNWHPSKNVLVFYSNGYENREQIFIADITDEYFMEEAPVNVRRLEFEEPKKTVNHCLYADFNSTGEDLYFTVKIEKENKKEKYNKYYNVAVVEEFFKYESKDFKGIKYDVLFNKKYDQIRPVCSPVDPNTIVFISFNKEFTENYGYADYSIVVHNRKIGTSAVVDNLTGYREYPFQWGPSGKKLYYCAALPIQKTPNNFRDKRTNIINLQVSDILFNGEKFKTRLEQNESSSFIMGDVATKDNGIAFVTDDLLLMAKYDPYESIFLVDMEKWRKNDGFYIKQLPIPDDNDFPVLGKKAFIFLKYQYFNMPDNTIKTVSTVNSIIYEPEIDEEALKAKKERREKKKKK